MENLLQKVYVRTITVSPTHQLFEKTNKECTNGFQKKFHVSSNGEPDKHRKNMYLVELSKRISACSLRGKPDLARKIFDGMHYQDSISWNLMIRGYLQNRRIEDARQLFNEMPERNIVSWNSMITAYARQGKTHIALKLFTMMPEKDIVTWTTMISGLSQNSRIDDSWRLFKCMTIEPNSVSWSAIVSGFRQNGFPAKALSLFKEMLECGTKPNSHSFASALAACGDLAALSNGQQLYSQVLKRGFDSDINVENSAISMFTKSGSLDNAKSVFDEMPRLDLVSWNSMIMGYGQHGYVMEAINIFHEMRKTGFKPDGVSFLALLQACSHCGFVEEGWIFFHGMERDHEIDTKPEHYACMVDMLARAGLLREAVELVKRMPFEPTGVFWRILLNGSRIFGNFELAEYAADRVWELEPDNAASCMMVMGMYEMDGRGKESAKMRELMKERERRKELGCSWIDVRGESHLFTTKDETHCETDSIYMILEMLAKDVCCFLDLIH